MSEPLTKDEEAALRTATALGDLCLLVVSPIPRLLATLDAERAESARLRGLFDAAGQGTYDVLALVDHYQDSALVAEAKVARLREALNALVRVYDAQPTRYDGILGLDWDSAPDQNAAGECWDNAVRVMAETGGEP